MRAGRMHGLWLASAPSATVVRPVTPCADVPEINPHLLWALLVRPTERGSPIRLSLPAHFE